MSEYAIELIDITKRYGDINPLAGLSLKAHKGSIYALLGVNGAGKTTTIKILAGMLYPTSGSGSVLGYPIDKSYPTVSLKERIGYVPERPALWDKLTGDELLNFAKGMHPRWDTATVKKFIDVFSLPLKRPVRSLSTGMRSQLALTVVMGGNPDLLILDEPTMGLDPLHRHEYLQLLLADAVDNGRTVFLSSHDLHQIERLADRVGILNDGRMAIDSPLDELKERFLSVRIAAVPGANLEQLRKALMGYEQIRSIKLEGSGILATVYGDKDALIAGLSTNPEVAAIKEYHMSLEEIFIKTVSK